MILSLHVLRLAASLAAEDEADLTGKGEHSSANVTLQEGTGIDEDENDDDEEMIVVSRFKVLFNWLSSCSQKSFFICSCEIGRASCRERVYVLV